MKEFFVFTVLTGLVAADRHWDSGGRNHAATEFHIGEGNSHFGIDEIQHINDHGFVQNNPDYQQLNGYAKYGGGIQATPGLSGARIEDGRHGYGYRYSLGHSNDPVYKLDQNNRGYGQFYGTDKYGDGVPAIPGLVKTRIDNPHYGYSDRYIYGHSNERGYKFDQNNPNHRQDYRDETMYIHGPQTRPGIGVARILGDRDEYGEKHSYGRSNDPGYKYVQNNPYNGQVYGIEKYGDNVQARRGLVEARIGNVRYADRYIYGHSNDPGYKLYQNNHYHLQDYEDDNQLVGIQTNSEPNAARIKNVFQFGAPQFFGGSFAGNGAARIEDGFSHGHQYVHTSAGYYGVPSRFPQGSDNIRTTRYGSNLNSFRHGYKNEPYGSDYLRQINPGFSFGLFDLYAQSGLFGDGSGIYREPGTTGFENADHVPAVTKKFAKVNAIQHIPGHENVPGKPRNDIIAQPIDKNITSESYNKKNESVVNTVTAKRATEENHHIKNGNGFNNQFVTKEIVSNMNVSSKEDDVVTSDDFEPVGIVDNNITNKDTEAFSSDSPHNLTESDTEFNTELPDSYGENDETVKECDVDDIDANTNPDSEEDDNGIESLVKMDSEIQDDDDAGIRNTTVIDENNGVLTGNRTNTVAEAHVFDLVKSNVEPKSQFLNGTVDSAGNGLH